MQIYQNYKIAHYTDGFFSIQSHEIQKISLKYLVYYLFLSLY